MFDPVSEKDVVNNLAPSKEIAMNEESEPEDQEPDPRTSSEIRSGVATKLNAARKFDIKQLKNEIWKIMEPKIPAYYRDCVVGTTEFRVFLQKDK